MKVLEDEPDIPLELLNAYYEGKTMFDIFHRIDLNK